MRILLCSFLFPLFCFGQLAKPPAHSPVIDDLKLLDMFEKGMTKLIEEKNFIEPKLFVKQLAAEPQLKRTLTLAPNQKRTYEPAELYAARLASTLLVGDVARCDECPLNHGDLAGGVAIGTNLVLTAYHVVDQKEVLAQGVMSFDGKVRPIKRILASDKDNDLALLEVSPGGLVPAPISTGDRVGDVVTAISHPAGRYYMLTQGRIARFTTYPLDPDKPKKGGYEAMEITADFAYGASGGPVYNRRGDVCGIIVTTESIYYEETRRRQTDLQMVIKACTPVSAIRKLLKVKGK